MTRILVVDDGPDVCKSIRENLEIDGYDVVTKSSSKEAMEYLEKEGQSLDVAIVDMWMEKKTSGLDLINFITHKHLPVAAIVLTGHGDEKNTVASMDAGAYSYIIKGGSHQLEEIRLGIHGAFLTLKEKRKVATAFGRLTKCLAEFGKQVDDFKSKLRGISQEFPELEESGDQQVG